MINVILILLGKAELSMASCYIYSRFQAQNMVWCPYCLSGSPYAKHRLLNRHLCIKIQSQTGVWDTHGVIFIFKTSPSQTYIQLQAQKGLTRVGPRRQTNELLVLLNEAEQLNHSYPMVTFKLLWLENGKWDFQEISIEG